MMDTLHYLLRVNLCWIIFYIVYWVLFRKHTFFIGNRLYLLASLFAGICIPAFEVTEQVDSPAMGIPLIRSVSSGPPSNAPVPQAVDWQLIILYLYLTGVFVMLFLLLKALVRICLIIRSGVTVPMDECRLVLYDRGNARSGSFSFLVWMVVSPEDYEANFEPIFAHELIHIRQWHSLDLLFIEASKVLFWFNPVLWLYKSSLQQLHEFLADDEATDKDAYATFMISYARQAMPGSIVSKFFNQSLLKQRIHMIYKRRTSKWMGWKYVSVFPLLAVTVMLMASRKYEYAKPTVEAVLNSPKVSAGSAAVEPLPEINETVASDESKHREALSRKSKSGPSGTFVETADGSRSTTIDSLPELEALISRLSVSVSNNDLKAADSLKKEITPLIWSESARLRKEQTENRLRSRELDASGDIQNLPVELDRLRSAVRLSSEERFQARWHYFDQMRTQFEGVVSTLRRQLNNATAEAERRTQDQIIQDLITAGVAVNKEDLSYRLHNMFLIVNGVEQPEALHQKLKSKYLKYSWMEWVYNWDGTTGHRFTGVRFNG